jgi:hypothetical protein
LKIQAAVLKLSVKPKPSFSVSGIPSEAEGGSLLPVLVACLKTHDGKNLKVAENRLSLQFDGKNYLCVTDDSDNSYHFGNIPAPTKAGTYTLKWILKGSK